MKHHFRLHALHRGNLAGIGLFRYDNPRPHTKQSRRVSHRLSMIASRSGNHTSCAFVRAQPRNKIDAATHFESTHWLVIFVFYVNFRADQRIYRRIPM
ncbi:MAG TPA: hypothetical protein VKR42_09530, partial [Ktedonobacteraceae bacterium]|nr:hypothetical protein [Ktedonobacteraceae bacterium]